MIYISDVSPEGRIGYVCYLSNGLDDIELLGWDRKEKEKEGAFIENEPEDFSAVKYLYINGSLVADPDYVEPEPEPTFEERLESQEEQLNQLTECILEMSGYVYQ